MTPEGGGPLLEATRAIESRTKLRPSAAVIAGSGLGSLSERLREPVAVPYRDIPGWPPTSVHGHPGELVVGHLGDRTVAVARGRAHLYEGHAAGVVAFPVDVLHALGATTLVVTNAAGALNPTYRPGQVMVLRDHIFLPGMVGHGPLVGVDDGRGPRFPDLLEAYDSDLRRAFVDAARHHGLAVHEGVYVMVAGPHFETPAEARMLRLLGADVVGMSTAPEVVAARRLGVRVLGVSVISNLVPLETPFSVMPEATPLHEEVTEVAGRAVPGLLDVVEAVLTAL